jgi:5-methylcytosine-specific restriction endonuclease McrA
MNKLQQITSIFSKPEYLSAAHEEAKKRLDQLNSQHVSHKINKYPEEIAKRKKIYHELQVLSEIRTKIRDKRVRSLANAKINKVRSTSSSTKRKHISKSEKIIACTYCERVHETVGMVMDHIYPIAKGGLDTPENTVLVCIQCNTKKSDKTLMVFCTQMKFDYLKVGERLLKMGKGV